MVSINFRDGVEDPKLDALRGQEPIVSARKQGFYKSNVWQFRGNTSNSQQPRQMAKAAAQARRPMISREISCLASSRESGENKNLQLPAGLLFIVDVLGFAFLALTLVALVAFWSSLLGDATRNPIAFLVTFFVCFPVFLALRLSSKRLRSLTAVGKVRVMTKSE